MWTFELIVMGAMIALNSVFAAYEIALASVGIARLDTLVREHHRGAASAMRMKRSMEASLAVVQLGITLVGAVAAATGGAGAEESILPVLLDLGISVGVARFLAIAMIVVPLTVVTIIAGELVPKVFALRNKEWVCLRLSPPMEWFSLIVWPAVWFFETSVTLIMSWGERRFRPEQALGGSDEAALQELRAIAALARMSRLIGSREEGIIVNAARISSTPVRAIMLPAAHISMIDAGASLADALVRAHLDMHTRFPITQSSGDPQDIVGYVNFKDIVAALRVSPGEASLRGIQRPLPSFQGDNSVASCLERMIREHTHIALVRDADGKIEGMITLEDILEELVGEIHDEYDRLPSHVTAAGSRWIAGGQASLDRLRELTGITLPVEGPTPVHTLNDWIVSRLGRPPHAGDQLTSNGATILVRKVRRQLVMEAILSGKSGDGTHPL